MAKSTKPRSKAPQLRPIQRLLAANRGEIAIRIFRAANGLNLHAPVAGGISKIHVAPGQQLEGKDLPFTIAPQEPAV